MNGRVIITICYIAWMICTDLPGELSSECSSSGDCNLDDFIIIKDCSPSARDQQFTAVGLTIRPTIDPTLCFTIMGYGTAKDFDDVTITTPIQLKLCEENNSNQQFVGYRSSGKFELSPFGRADRCLGSFHHPKPYEKIHPKSCTAGRIHTTSEWIKY
ncbi:hypothetical protein ACHAW5_000997 [Stephanodiscus triporus]|uniref:Uncharacterized protein n=1 Tax=Stephanodiscus triporus TaxID=2934178 RepID=A0ABD3PG34_9STRA